MANEFHITAGLLPADNGDESGVNKFYITAGLPPDDTAADGIDETGKLISITSTISAGDFQAYKDLQKLIAISSVISATDLQAYKETAYRKEVDCSL